MQTIRNTPIDPKGGLFHLHGSNPQLFDHNAISWSHDDCQVIILCIDFLLTLPQHSALICMPENQGHARLDDWMALKVWK